MSIYYYWVCTADLLPKDWPLGGQVHVVRRLSTFVGFVQQLTVLWVPAQTQLSRNNKS